jgi:hypothetical protein
MFTHSEITLPHFDVEMMEDTLDLLISLIDDALALIEDRR